MTGMVTTGDRTGWFGRLRSALARSSARIGDGLASIAGGGKLDDDSLGELEDLLIAADLGIGPAATLTQAVARHRPGRTVTPDEVRLVLAEQIARILEPVARPLVPDPARRPHVVLVVGVNGSGKTTTIGKLAKQHRDAGRRVVLAAGDTFRAAAVEQLTIWGERTGATVVARDQGADAAGLAFDALKQARDDAADLLLIDTAGRLHNKGDLMQELQKIARVLGKQDPTAPHDVVLVLDATIGQNALVQVQTFRAVTHVTGLVLTKLDGSARGGVLVALAEKTGLPVHAVGVGEAAEDLRPFDPMQFACGLVGIDAP